jgi:hypothetical protein
LAGGKIMKFFLKIFTVSIFSILGTVLFVIPGAYVIADQGNLGNQTSSTPLFQNNQTNQTSFMSINQTTTTDQTFPPEHVTWYWYLNNNQTTEKKNNQTKDSQSQVGQQNVTQQQSSQGNSQQSSQHS